MPPYLSLPFWTQVDVEQVIGSPSQLQGTYVEHPGPSLPSNTSKRTSIKTLIHPFLTKTGQQNGNSGGGILSMLFGGGGRRGGPYNKIRKVPVKVEPKVFFSNGKR